MELRERVDAVLGRLGLSGSEFAECVMVLLDDRTPSPFPKLAEAGLSFADGAGTQAILRAIAPRLGKRKIDREARDYIMLPLREVGVLGIAYADASSREVRPSYWKPKSPNNVYVVVPEFRALLAVTDEDFDESVADWIAGTEERLARLATAEAAAAAANADDRLVPLTVAHYCANALPDYEVVFVDDSDARESTEWTANVERYDLPLNLATRWPDIVLRHPESDRFWVVDCVESDGEIDAVRKAEIESAFRDRGHEIDGFTTAYRTMARYAQRQRAHDNIALNTFVWVMECGGAQWLKVSLPDPTATE